MSDVTFSPMVVSTSVVPDRRIGPRATTANESASKRVASNPRGVPSMIARMFKATTTLATIARPVAKSVKPVKRQVLSNAQIAAVLRPYGVAWPVKAAA